MRPDDPFRLAITPGDLVRVQVHHPTDGFRPGRTDALEGIFMGNANVPGSIAVFHGFILLTGDGPIEVMWQSVVWGGLQSRLSEAQG